MAINEGTCPFPEGHKIHDLQALFLETLSQFLGHAAVLKLPSPMAPLPSCLSPAMTTPGQPHCHCKLRTEDSGEEELYFATVTSVFILLSHSVCLQTYHSTAARCKSMCSSWVGGLWQILMFHIWPAACTEALWH